MCAKARLIVATRASRRAFSKLADVLLNIEVVRVKTGGNDVPMVANVGMQPEGSVRFESRTPVSLGSLGSAKAENL